MRVLSVLPAALPLLAAGLAMVLSRWPWAQRAVALVTLATCLTAAVLVTVEADRSGPVVTRLGDWPADIGIAFVVDVAGGLLLSVALATMLCVLVFAVGQPGVDDQYFFHPVYLVLASGVGFAFSTGDLFNLFVAFELLLSSSYVLLVHGGSRPQVRSGMTYVVINMVASTLFVTAVGLIYAATGTVNMAELSVRLAEIDPGVRTALGLFLLLVFGIKAAVFPLFFWLPDSYPTTPSPVTAVFAGLLTKIGVYAMLRSSTIIVPGDDTILAVLLVVAGLTMVIGVLGAIAQDDMKRILSFHIVSQVGYMILGIGLATVAGVAGALFFMVHQIPVKAALFCVTGMVEHGTGTAALPRLGGLRHRAPLLAGLFAVAALSLAGLPPTSGFVGKLGLVEAGFADGAWVVTGVSLAVSLFTLLSMTKIWAGAFWGEPDHPTPAPAGDGRLTSPPLMSIGTGGLVAMAVAIAAFAGPLFDLCQRAAQALVDPSPYLRAVGL